MAASGTSSCPQASTAASSSGGYAADGASEHVTLLSRTEAKDYEKKTGRHGRKNARAVLNKMISGGHAVEFRADGTSFYLDTDEEIGASEHIGTWRDWKTYIANQEEDVIGDTGIARLTCEFIENT